MKGLPGSAFERDFLIVLRHPADDDALGHHDPQKAAVKSHRPAHAQLLRVGYAALLEEPHQFGGAQAPVHVDVFGAEPDFLRIDGSHFETAL